MKNYLYSIFIVLSTTLFLTGCSNDGETDTVSTLKMNGTPVKIYSNVDGEWDSRSKFLFWVNGIDAIAQEDGVYIQASINRTDNDIQNSTLNLNVGEDVTDRFSILLEYKHGDGFITGWGRDNNKVSTYLSGNVKVRELDKTKHLLTLEFGHLTYDSTDDDDISVDKIVLTGTLVIPYKVIVE